MIWTTRGSSSPRACEGNCGCGLPGPTASARVPEGVMGGGGLEGLQVIKVGPDITPVVFERLDGPRGQGFVSVVVLLFRAHVESQLAPRDQLIQESLRRLAHSPPSGPTAGSLGGNPVEEPALGCHDSVKNLMHRHVAEVEIGREVARSLLFGFVSV